MVAPNILVLGAALLAQAADLPPQRAHALANLASYVRSGDMPVELVAGGPLNVRVHFELSVTPEGRVSACRVTQSSGVSQLDAITCRIMRSRARFEPARDSEGRPVPDIVTSVIAWVAS
ncbi:MAG: TonB family protein [Alphaproteobacteria bacterium]|nr:MAG: TonB family protein [Alphaproteobacteria bacterium]